MPEVLSTHIDGAAFADALVSGIHRVIGEQEELNRINVFPVADGDTGTNLCLSLGAVLPTLRQPGEKHLGLLLATVADGMLDGARGNSGAIVAQFFQGFSDAVGEREYLAARAFAAAFRRGSDYARDALSEPRDGTIISIISSVADRLTGDTDSDETVSYAALFRRAAQSAETAVAATTDQLEVLRKAGVVDAGAKGFAALLDGMAEYFQFGRIVPEPDLATLAVPVTAVDAAGSAAESEFRFCTECIVTAAEIDRRKLREALSALGNSLVLAGTHRKAKIHVHVDDPESVFRIARGYGIVSAEKADDMHRQLRSSHDRQRRFAVIADSAADISDEDLERLDIHIVPCRVQFGERGYLDKVGISAEEFFAELETNPDHPTTSQPSPGEFRRQFQFLASHFSDVVSINLTGTVSGTLEAARSAAERSDAPGRIHIVDSRNASQGQGLLVVYAAECAAAGRSAADTLAEIDRLIPETRTFALLNDLRYPVRGGRLPRWVRSIAVPLRLTPILHTTEDGRVTAGGFLIGKGSRLARFARHVARRVDRNRPLNVGISHAMCASDAIELERQLRRVLPDIRRLTVTELGAALGVHGGPGTLIVAVQPQLAGDRKTA